MKQDILKVLALGFLVVVAAGLSACNTVEGFGKDLQGAGQSIEGSASRR